MMLQTLCRVWMDDEGQDIAEYALMLAVVLLIVGILGSHCPGWADWDQPRLHGCC